MEIFPDIFYVLDIEVSCGMFSLSNKILDNNLLYCHLFNLLFAEHTNASLGNNLTHLYHHHNPNTLIVYVSLIFHQCHQVHAQSTFSFHD